MQYLVPQFNTKCIDMLFEIAHYPNFRSFAHYKDPDRLQYVLVAIFRTNDSIYTSFNVALTIATMENTNDFDKLMEDTVKLLRDKIRNS